MALKKRSVQMEAEFKKRSQWWHDKWGDVRVMTVCEGYVLARRPHCTPFVKSIADFLNTFKEGRA